MAEKVHGILGYYDGILDGVADFMGTPHAFSIEGDHDVESPLYRLKAISEAEFALFSEYWQMWRRWEDTAGADPVRALEVYTGMPPVLPQDRPRHDEIEPVVKKMLDVPVDSGRIARGSFRPSPAKNDARDGRWGGYEVVWAPEEVAVQPDAAADGATPRR